MLGGDALLRIQRQRCIKILCPTLSFVSLIFQENAGKPTKKQGFFIPTEPLKSLEKKGKTQYRQPRE